MGRQYKALAAAGAGFNPETELLQLGAHPADQSVLARADRDGDIRGGIEKARDLDQRGLDGRIGFASGDQARGVLSACRAAGGCENTEGEPTLLERQVDIHAAAPGKNDSLGLAEASEVNHRIDDLVLRQTALLVKHVSAPFERVNMGQLRRRGAEGKLRWS